MRDPMRKRIPRELKHDIGKYIALFLFLVGCIGFISGFIVADESLKARYDTSFEEFNVEDGHFLLEKKALKKVIEKVEDAGVDVYPMFYKERTIKAYSDAAGEEDNGMVDKEDNDTAGDVNTNATGDVIRLYKLRDKVNLSDLWEGENPKTSDEIAIDRIYAENNGLKIGDTIKAGGHKYRITGITALSDYSALFRNNADTMFDATDFSVALVTREGFEKAGDKGLMHCYSWVNREKDLSDKERHDQEEDVKDALIDAVKEESVVDYVPFSISDAVLGDIELGHIPVTVPANNIEDFVGREENQAINFAGDDMGKDRVMMTTLLYIVIVIMAFIFAITVKSTIEKEAKTIGTLRASGYTRGEMLRHYMMLPLIVTAAAAVTGNICGYTFMKNICSAMYLHSYSLLPFDTVWSFNAFRDTTAVPLVIIVIIVLLIISKELRISPLRFLREDFGSRGGRHAIKLRNGRFMSRFRKRVLIQNIPSYIVMFFGILFSVIIMLFCLGMYPLLQHYEDIIMDSGMAEYQYVLKEPYKVKADSAEKYQVTSLKNADSRAEDVTVYGIRQDSRYLDDLDLPDVKNEAKISSANAAKYQIKKGDTIKLKEEYEKKVYKIKVTDIYDYEAQLCVFMDFDRFNQMFENNEGEYAGYFSDVELDEIPDGKIATKITKDDYATITKQLDSSMGDLFKLFTIFGVMIFIIVIYLLSKVLIEKNAKSIAMSKILGYSDGEISSIYNRVTTFMVSVSLLACLPLGYLFFKFIFRIMMMFFTGWLTYYIHPSVYIKTVAIGVISYLFIHVLQLRRIKKVPMGEVLKGME